jgi:hypothetical protein
MKILALILAALACIGTSAFALEIIVRTESNEILLIDAAPADTIEDIESIADQYDRCPEDLRKEVFQDSVVKLNSLPDESGLQPEAGVSRNYHAAVSDKEKADISYIVNTLSDLPTPKLLFYKSSLTQAGDRINQVHPLNFMATIFTDEVLRVKVRNIKRKGWVWKDFMGGLRNSMNEEKAKGNLKTEFFDDFCSRVGIDYRKIENPISRNNWDDLVDVLIKHSESQGDNDRYRM